MLFAYTVTIYLKPDNSGIRTAELASCSPKLTLQKLWECFSLPTLSSDLHPHQHTFPSTMSQTDLHYAARQYIIAILIKFKAHRPQQPKKLMTTPLFKPV